VFGKLAEGRNLIHDEHQEPWSEEFVQVTQDQAQMMEELQKRKADELKEQKRKDDE
jgi:HAE1 family hydrophobic/amphiphilic exporter-1